MSWLMDFSPSALWAVGAIGMLVVGAATMAVSNSLI